MWPHSLEVAGLGLSLKALFCSGDRSALLCMPYIGMMGRGWGNQALSQSTHLQKMQWGLEDYHTFPSWTFKWAKNCPQRKKFFPRFRSSLDKGEIHESERKWRSWESKMTKIISIKFPGGGDVGRKPHLRVSSNLPCLHSVLIPCHDRELFVPQVSSVRNIPKVETCRYNAFGINMPTK